MDVNEFDDTDLDNCGPTSNEVDYLKDCKLCRKLKTKKKYRESELEHWIGNWPIVSGWEKFGISLYKFNLGFENIQDEMTSV